MNELILLVLIIFAVKLFMVLLNIEGGNYNPKNKLEGKEGELVKLPRSYLFFGSAFTIFFAIFVIGMLLSGQAIPIYGYLIVLFFFLATFSMVIAYANWRIILKRDSFIYRTFFRRKYTFHYRDIDKCVIKNDIIILSIKEKRKKFIIDPHSLGIELFINRIPPQRRK